MSNKTGAQSNETREKKRAEFSGTDRKKHGKKPILFVALLAAIGLAAFLVVNNSSDQPASRTVTSPSISGSTGGPGDIKIPVADLASGKAKFFDYKLPDKTPVRFFAVKSPDGTLRAAMDACEICFHAKKGYHQEGDDMVCNNCDKHFATSLVGEVNGGCHPIGLERTIAGDQLVIKVSELESRGEYFQ